MELKKSVLALALLSLLSLGACNRKDEPNKILDGASVDTTQTILPAEAAQQWLMLSHNTIQVIVPVINRMNNLTPSYPELTGPDGSFRYTFTITNAYYGTVTVTAQFLNASGTAIDPIAAVSSTTTLKSVTLTGTSSSRKFTYTESLTLTLATAGDVNSSKTLWGTTTFTGSGTTMTFTLTTVAGTSFEGLTSGTVSATGTGPGAQAATATLDISSDHAADGTIAWESKSGTLHLKNNGTGFIISDQSRLLLD